MIGSNSKFLRLSVAAFAGIVWSSTAFSEHELDGRNLDQGKSLYANHCATCHGADLEGQPDWKTPGEDGVLPAPPHDETGHTWHHDTQLLIDYTSLGGQAALAQRGVTDFKSGMPAFGDTLSDNQIMTILAFIRSTWPRRIQDIQASRNPPHQ